MKKINMSISIEASPETVWKNIVSDEAYRQWTDAWCPNCYFEGSWEQGEKIRFIGVDENGDTGGMVAVIEKNIPHEHISIKHIGYIENGIEKTEGPEITSWAPAYENYTLKKVDGCTEFIMEMDTVEEYYDIHMEAWPKAMEKLKEISEASL